MKQKQNNEITVKKYFMELIYTLKLNEKY